MCLKVKAVAKALAKTLAKALAKALVRALPRASAKAFWPLLILMKPQFSKQAFQGSLMDCVDFERLGRG